MSDNRRATRHLVSIAAKLNIDGQSVEGKVMNLSVGGALIAVGTKYAMGQRMEISFTVPNVNHPIEIGAVVRWTDATGVGVQFDGLRARDVWALNEFFKRLP